MLVAPPLLTVKSIYCLVVLFKIAKQYTFLPILFINKLEKLDKLLFIVILLLSISALILDILILNAFLVVIIYILVLLIKHSLKLYLDDFLYSIKFVVVVSKSLL